MGSSGLSKAEKDRTSADKAAEEAKGRLSRAQEEYDAALAKRTEAIRAVETAKTELGKLKGLMEKEESLVPIDPLIPPRTCQHGTYRQHRALPPTGRVVLSP